jgi:pilus assembly protein CpaB
MKILRNKLFIGILCILLAVLVGFVLIPSLNRQQTDTTVVLQLKQDVHEGEAIDRNMLEPVAIPHIAVSKQAVRSADDAAGKLAAHDLYAGDFLTKEKITASIDTHDAFRKGTAQNKRVIAITLPSLACGLSGKLQPGDIVSVLSIPKAGSLNQTLDTTNPSPSSEDAEAIPDDQCDTKPIAVIWDELRAIEVCAVTTAKGKTPDTSADTPELPATVLLYVTDLQAAQLVELEQTSRLHLIFVARGSDADEYLPNRVLN